MLNRSTVKRTPPGNIRRISAALRGHRLASFRSGRCAARPSPSPCSPAGLAQARGEFVTFPDSHVEVLAGNFAARLRAHDVGYAMVSEATLNGTRTPWGWASYFLDHASVLPTRRSSPMSGPPDSCSYRRDVLLEAGGFPGRPAYRRGHRRQRRAHSARVSSVLRARRETRAPQPMHLAASAPTAPVSAGSRPRTCDSDPLPGDAPAAGARAHAGVWPGVPSVAHRQYRCGHGPVGR